MPSFHVYNGSDLILGQNSTSDYLTFQNLNQTKFSERKILAKPKQMAMQPPGIGGVTKRPVNAQAATNPGHGQAADSDKKGKFTEPPFPGTLACVHQLGEVQLLC